MAFKHISSKVWRNICCSRPIVDKLIASTGRFLPRKLHLLVGPLGLYKIENRLGIHLEARFNLQVMHQSWLCGSRQNLRWFLLCLPFLFWAGHRTDPTPFNTSEYLFLFKSVALWGWSTKIRPHQLFNPEMEALLQSIQGKGKAAAAPPMTMTPGRGKTALPMTTTPSKGKVAAAPGKAAITAGLASAGRAYGTIPRPRDREYRRSRSQFAKGSNNQSVCGGDW